jgi:hypothetical protein
MSVSINVVDCVYRRPAVNLAAYLMHEVGSVFTEQWRDRTNDEGRARTCRIRCSAAAPM